MRDKKHKSFHHIRLQFCLTPAFSLRSTDSGGPAMPESILFPSVTLTCTAGGLRGKQFRFEQPTLCTIGRSRDCCVRLPSDWAHMTVSRRHCLLEIDPPVARVRDLGSTNGTFVNGTLVGHRDPIGFSEESETLLHDSDKLCVGNTTFVVHIAPEEAEEDAEPAEVAQPDDEFACMAGI
jgi:pSer/pThr/pTyr-binding forkhead associated (FHA) protein